MVNWWLGLYLLQFQDRRWFYFTLIQIERAQRWFQQYGYYTLLLAWLPEGALTLVAGIMKVRLRVFIVMVVVGKAPHYVAVIYFSA